MIKEAAKTGIIPIDPTVGVPSFAEKPKQKPKQKSILSMEEINKLFAPSKIGQVWQSNPVHYCLNLLSASTGMKQGECLGLQLQNIHFDDKYIEVRHSYSAVQRLKDTKNHEIRLVPLANKTTEALSELIQINKISQPEELIFILPETGKLPDSKSIGRILYHTFSMIGISQKEREKRNITFHSYRHLFNSLCRSRSVPDAKIRQAMGHKTTSRTDHYLIMVLWQNHCYLLQLRMRFVIAQLQEILLQNL